MTSEVTLEAQRQSSTLSKPANLISLVLVNPDQQRPVIYLSMEVAVHKTTPNTDMLMLFKPIRLLDHGRYSAGDQIGLAYTRIADREMPPDMLKVYNEFMPDRIAMPVRSLIMTLAFNEEQSADLRAAYWPGH